MKRMEKIKWAMSIEFNEITYEKKRQWDDVTTLSLWEASFDIPLFDFNKLPKDKIYRYCDGKGILGLREKIINYYNINYWTELNIDNIIISAWSKLLLYSMLYTIIEEWDEVVYFEPAWVSYPEQIKLK